MKKPPFRSKATNKNLSKIPYFLNNIHTTIPHFAAEKNLYIKYLNHQLKPMKKKHATSFPPKTPPCGAKSLSCCCSNNLPRKPPLWIEESRSDHCSFWPRVPLCWNSPVGRKEGEHRFFQGKHFEMWDVSNFGEEMDGMMIRMFIRDEARGNEALSGVLFNNIQKQPAFTISYT